MRGRLLTLIISLLGVPALLLTAAPAAWGSGDWLSQRQLAWPEWQLPAALPRPRRSDDLLYPQWFAGTWTVESIDLSDDSSLVHSARFTTAERGGPGVVGDRVFNAKSIGRVLLGDQLLTVEQAPGQVNRQLARLSGDRQLETTVIGRRQSNLGAAVFQSDELVLQILHGPGAPRISRIETLSRYQRCDRDSTRICALQWQARFPPPGETLQADPVSVSRFALTLTPQPDPTASAGPPADHAT